MTGRYRLTRRWLAVLTAVVSFLSAAHALAATPIGQTTVPADPCSAGTTLVQAGSPGFSYLAPSPGVITSWSFQADATPPRLKLKLLRAAGGTNFTAVGESQAETPAPSTISTFATRVPVQAGEGLGLTLLSNGPCATNGVAGHSLCVAPVDVAIGTTVTFPACGTSQLDVSAILEPDADDDGFGDESQDQCPTDASKQGECVPPQTEITKRPKDKTRKKQATFGFSANESGGSFECSLDEKAFAPCASPHTVKVKRGLHRLEVRARDAAGNVDPTPAIDLWKVKKKR